MLQENKEFWPFEYVEIYKFEETQEKMSLKNDQLFVLKF